MARIQARNVRAAAAAAHPAQTTEPNEQADPSDVESNSEEVNSNGENDSEEDSSDERNASETHDGTSDEGSDSDSHDDSSDEGDDGVDDMTRMFQVLHHCTYREYRDERVETGPGWNGRFYTSISGNVHDATRPPPEDCFNCGGNHWRKDCPRRRRY